MKTIFLKTFQKSKIRRKIKNTHKSKIKKHKSKIKNTHKTKIKNTQTSRKHRN